MVGGGTDLVQSLKDDFIICEIVGKSMGHMFHCSIGGQTILLLSSSHITLVVFSRRAAPVSSPPRYLKYGPPTWLCLHTLRCGHICCTPSRTFPLKSFEFPIAHKFFCCTSCTSSDLIRIIHWPLIAKFLNLVLSKLYIGITLLESELVKYFTSLHSQRIPYLHQNVRINLTTRWVYLLVQNFDSVEHFFLI